MLTSCIGGNQRVSITLLVFLDEKQELLTVCVLHINSDTSKGMTELLPFLWMVI